jgi:hypothetical protein
MSKCWCYIYSWIMYCVLVRMYPILLVVYSCHNFCVKVIYCSVGENELHVLFFLISIKINTMRIKITNVASYSSYKLQHKA